MDLNFESRTLKPQSYHFHSKLSTALCRHVFFVLKLGLPVTFPMKYTTADVIKF